MGIFGLGGGGGLQDLATSPLFLTPIPQGLNLLEPVLVAP